MDGAALAGGFGLQANGGAEFHEGLIVIAGVFGVEEGVGGIGEGFDGLAVAGECLGVVAEAGENTHNVAIHDGGGIVLCDGGNGGGGVGADTGESYPFVGVFGRLRELNKYLREFLEVACAAVVAEAFPLFEDVFGGGVGEALKIGKVVHPVFKVGKHGFNLGLLEHELGNNGAVEAGLGAPWQWTPGVSIPSQEVGAEAVGWFW